MNMIGNRIYLLFCKHLSDGQGGHAYLKARHFDRFAAGMKEIGATEIYVRDERRTIYAKTDKGWVLIFPMLTEREADDPDTISLA